MHDGIGSSLLSASAIGNGRLSFTYNAAKAMQATDKGSAHSRFTLPGLLLPDIEARAIVAIAHECKYR